MKFTAKSEVIGILCLLILAGGNRAIADDVKVVKTVGPEALEELRERWARLHGSLRSPFDGISAHDLISTGTTWLVAVDSARTKEPHLRAVNLSRAFRGDAEVSWVDLSGADLRGADLSGADLSWADLRGADLHWADLSGAFLYKADLSGARLISANLRGAFLNEADLSGAELIGADLSGADLRIADLIEADLSGADLSRADLMLANLSFANLGGADLSGANLIRADLSGANLIEADITSATLAGAILRECYFEPHSSYSLQHGIPKLEGLDRIRYMYRKEMLVGMRNALKEGGYREWERAVTAGINRRDNELRRWDLEFVTWVGFDLTCAYGFKNLRPLSILYCVWVVWSVIYFLIFRFASGATGVELAITYRSKDGKELEDKYRVRPGMQTPEGWPKAPSLIGLALYFSLLSTFNLKFRWIEVGGWIRLLQPRIFDLRPLGWVRPLSGFQALLSIYLVALWVLTTFGRPFDG